MIDADNPWVPTLLGAICQINPSKPQFANLSDETPVLFVPMAAVDNVTGEIAAPEYRTLGEVRAKSFRTFAPDDVIFAKITPCMENGKAAVVPDITSDIGFGSTEFHVLRPNAGVNPRFIWHYVRRESFRQAAKEQMTGSVGQARVPATYLENSPIYLPPETTQNSIVGFLDNALALDRSATTHLSNAYRAIERFRQAVLASACSGCLTVEWREQNINLPPANGIVDLIRQRRRPRPDQRYKLPINPRSEDRLPPSWCWTTVGALVDVATGATPLRNHSDYYGGTIPWVTSGAVNAGFITNATEYITEQAIRETNAKVFPPGTLLVAMYGEGQTRGRVAELGIAAATNQAVAALLFNEDNEFLRPYLKLFFLGMVQNELEPM